MHCSIVRIEEDVIMFAVNPLIRFVVSIWENAIKTILTLLFCWKLEHTFPNTFVFGLKYKEKKAAINFWMKRNFNVDGDILRVDFQIASWLYLPLVDLAVLHQQSSIDFYVFAIFALSPANWKKII